MCTPTCTSVRCKGRSGCLLELKDVSGDWGCSHVHRATGSGSTTTKNHTESPGFSFSKTDLFLSNRTLWLSAVEGWTGDGLRR